MKINYLPLEHLKPYPNNAKIHTVKQLEGIAQSIQQFGFKQPIVVDASLTIVAGHGRYEAAAALGIANVPCLIASDLTDEQIRAYRLLDNKLAESGIDTDILALELDTLDFDFTPFLVEFPVIEKIEAGKTEEDAIPEFSDDSVTKPGDIWLLGKHRVMCGDSTSIDASDKLMSGERADMVFTDPPYGVNASGGRTQTVKRDKIKKIENDDLAGCELQQFISDALLLIPLKDNASFYVCYDQKTQHEFTGALKQIYWKQKNTIIWNKNNFGLSGHKGYRPKFEMIAFGHVGESYEWFGGNDQADVWDIARETERHGNHPAPKPIAVIEKALMNSSSKGQLVVDIFGGSGSTLIACQKTNRTCYMMELSPNYCDLIIKRWQDYTGKEAILETNGHTYAEIGRTD